MAFVVVFISVLLLSFFETANSQFDAYEIVFPSEGNYAAASLKEVPFKDNTKDLTVCFRVNHTRARVTYFSYSVPSDYNNIVIEGMDKASELWVNRKKLRFDTEKRELNKYVHYCYTWSAGDGKVQTFKDGKKATEKTFEESKSLSIKEKGIIVLGQDQDDFGRSFDPSTSLTGSITDVEVWDRVLTDPEVLAASNNNIAGNIVSWICAKDKWILKEVTISKSDFLDDLMKGTPSVPKNTKITEAMCNLDITTPTVPDVSVPTGEVPSGEVPSGETPSGDVPSEEVPSGDVPSGEDPSGNAQQPSGNNPNM